MSDSLTLKQKLELFKLAKKPRKQIRLKLQVITNNLNLPNLKKSSLHKQGKKIQSAKMIKAMNNINNFKKIDKTVHNFQTINQLKNKQNNFKQSIYHSNYNTQFLLNDFNFNMRLTEKVKTQNQKNKLSRTTHFDPSQYKKHITFIGNKTQKNVFKFNNSSSPREIQNQCIKVIKIKNQYNSLKNLNKIFRLQLQNSYQIEDISMRNNNKITEMMISSNDEFRQ